MSDNNPPCPNCKTAPCARGRARCWECLNAEIMGQRFRTAGDIDAEYVRVKVKGEVETMRSKGRMK